MLIPFASCATTEETGATGSDTADAGSAGEVETKFDPGIQKNDYQADFNVIVMGWNQDYYFPEEVTPGDLMGDAVDARTHYIEDRLGVKFNVVDAGSWTEYASAVARAAATGDDNYQLVMTHVYQGITEMITSNCLYDYADLESINMDQSYWNGQLMEEMKINDKYLLGYNDFCLSHTHVITFNKDMLDEYQLESPYPLVRNKTWTIDKFFELASHVSRDNGDGVWDDQDTYGLSGWGWIYLISFVTASDMKIVDKNEDDYFYIAYEDNQEKMLSLIDKVYEMYYSDYSYMWKSTGGTTLGLSTGRVLFQLESSTSLPGLQESGIRFGVLPYPLYDSAQKEYRSLNWNGMLLIPQPVTNPDMVSDVMELLAYKTDAVQTAYYETLLGARIAEAPDDVDMLNIIWDSQVSDIGLVCANAATQMDALVYMIPKMCEGKKKDFGSFMKTNKRSAQRGLDTVFKQK